MERSAYRIIDANFNRAREAARVIEEYCRFVLNSKSLSERAKQLRHQLCRVVDGLDSNLLLSSRDTKNDVGIGQVVADQYGRNQLSDCLVAACRRLTEALRALSECTQSQKESVWQVFEQLRYSAYTLEKDIFLLSRPAERFEKVSLYVMLSGDNAADMLSLAGKCIAGGADCIRLQAQNLEDHSFLTFATDLVRLCKENGVISIINKRVDIALASGADGVHLDQDDLPIECVRKLQLGPMIIGKSTYSTEQLRAAIIEQPTYVTVGSVCSPAEGSSMNPVDPEYLREATNILENTAIASVVTGGINMANVDSVIAAGIGRIAICVDITKVKEPTEFCRFLKQKIANKHK
jgi:thiamine-phosphate pyrophosphorylase